MSVAYILLGIAIAGTLSSGVYLVLSILGAMKFHRDANAQRHEAEAIPSGSLPPVSLLKPVHGMESHLRENIESFFHLDYPDYEILFAADLEDNAALSVVREICARYPHIPTHIVITGRPPWPNPPAYAFFRMAEHAENNILVTSDSDVFVDPSYLREVVPPMLDPQNGMLTCVYRGKNTGGFWSAVHAIGMSVEMTAGVVTANLLEGMKFGLGPTIVVRRDALEKIGGYAVLGDYFANDFVIGNLIEKHGYRVVLSRHIIDHVVSPLTFARVWEHEVRWAKSTRWSRPLRPSWLRSDLRDAIRHSRIYRRRDARPHLAGGRTARHRHRKSCHRQLGDRLGHRARPGRPLVVALPAARSARIFRLGRELSRQARRLAQRPV